MVDCAGCMRLNGRVVSCIRFYIGVEDVIGGTTGRSLYRGDFK